MLDIRQARVEEADRVCEFYDRLVDDYEHSTLFRSWKKGIYPSEEMLRGAVERGEAYVGERHGEIVAGMVLNHEQHESYRQVRWSVDAPDEEVLVVHLLGVALACVGQGLARAMAAGAVEIAKAAGMRTLRLDTLSGNLAAQRAYAAAGFRYVETLGLYYENTGLTEFQLLEYVI